MDEHAILMKMLCSANTGWVVRSKMCRNYQTYFQLETLNLEDVCSWH
jgi:hypothetical protein